MSENYYKAKIVRLKRYIRAIAKVLQEKYGFSEKDIIELTYVLHGKLR